MLSYYYSFLFSLYTFSLMMLMVLIFLWLEKNNFNFLLITLNNMNFDFNSMELNYMFNKSGILFSVVVLFISTFIYIYSYYYLGISYKTNYFCLLLFIFIASMIYTINCSSLLFVMLGWDGLGFSSYLLICYYMNNVSLSNALFTLMTNRLGDIFMLWFIIMLQVNSSPISVKYLSVMPLLVGLMTKSAIFPFSNWLPAAMSAPTPVSALVHSSTLVTSGLWLMMKNYYFLMSNYSLMKYMVIISLFTILYSGLNTICEMDMKKLIALSTLSHMGFICFSLSLGLVNLAFFHLMVHALFKSMLFMAMGMIIVNNEHYQDIRYLSAGSKVSSFSFNLLYFSILNLLGMPMLSGYFSKDLVLEMTSYSMAPWAVELMIYIMMFLSFYYSMKLFTYSQSECNSNPYKLSNKINTSLMMILLTMMTMNIIFFKMLASLVLMEYIFFGPVNIMNKIILFSMLFMMIGLAMMKNIIYYANEFYIYFNTMMNLSFMSKHMTNSFFFKSLNLFSNNEYLLSKFSLMEMTGVNTTLFNTISKVTYIYNLFLYLLVIMMIVLILV